MHFQINRDPIASSIVIDPGECFELADGLFISVVRKFVCKD